jgi:hypothetical protein
MTDRAACNVDGGAKLLRAVATTMAGAGLIAITLLNAPPIHAQPQGSTASRPAFDVASVKPWKDDGMSPRNSHSTYGPQGIEFGARTLGFIIGEAYKLPAGLILPGSFTKEFREGYDIVAKADHAVPKEQLRLCFNPCWRIASS